jgi:hypothetical protein
MARPAKELLDFLYSSYPLQDAAGFANLIKQLDTDSDRYNEVAAKCRQRAKEFDIYKMVEGYCNVYQNLTDRLSEKVN